MCNSRFDLIFCYFHSSNPSPNTELYSINDFTLLIAIMLSAQTTDRAVNAVTKGLFLKCSQPDDFLKRGAKKLENDLKTIGLYKTKTKNVILLSRILIEKYGAKIPKEADELIKLPGVGRKTANVFLNLVYGFPTIGVDTHVIRLANRLGMVKNEKNPLKIESTLMKIIKPKWHKNVSLWLILHGRKICLARKPKCEQCGIMQYCGYVKR
jgi:endonuclease III